MDAPEHWEDLLEHLSQVAALDRRQASRLVDEVLAYFAESAAEYVARRHAELQAEGRTNPAIFDCITGELRQRRFAAPELTARQLRRLVYG